MTISILLVEDDAAFAVALKATLKRSARFDFVCETVGWLREATDRLQQCDFDVILLDVTLPDSQGLDTVLSIRQQCPFVPLIVLTGREDDIAVESLRIGAQDYLLKGKVDGPLLARAINYAIERARLIEQREEFIATLTHDLKNPLIGANRILELMANGALEPISEKHSTLLNKVTQTNTHLLLMIENLLEVYRLEKDLNPILLMHTNLLAIVSSCIDQIEPIAQQKQVVIEQHLDTLDQPVLADQEAIRRVVLNLLDNALKFTPAGGRIGVRLRQEASEVVLQVSDTGPGITNEDGVLLFEKFGRGKAGRQFRHGTGLGLFLCKKLVEMHGGTISYTSNVGTTFNVQLPLTAAAVGEHA